MSDLIDRQAAIYIASGYCHPVNIAEELRKLPSVQPESKREWYMKGYRDAQAVSCTDFCVDCPLFDKEKHECPRFNRVIPRAIEEVKPRWIPVTEALPDRGKTVLITNGKGNVRSGRFRGIELWKDKDVAYWTFKGNTVEHVLAWMPLPEPWRGEEHEL